jgi:hypothetical protein
MDENFPGFPALLYVNNYTWFTGFGPPGPRYLASPKARIGKNINESKTRPTVKLAVLPKESERL